MKRKSWTDELVKVCLVSAVLFLTLAAGSAYAATVPDFRGTWTYEPSSFVQTGCQNPLDNISFNDPGEGTFSIPNQTDANFSFTVVGNFVDGGDTIEETFTYTGTIASDGLVNSSSNYVGYSQRRILV